MADGDRRGRRRDRRGGLEIGDHRARLDPEEHGDVVDRDPVAGFEDGDGGLSRGELGLGTGDVEVAGQAGLVAGGGDVDRLGLDADVLAGDLDASLEAAGLNVVAGHLGDQGDQHVAPGLFRGLDVGIGRLDRAADAGPNDVDLPRGIELGVVQIEGGAWRGELTVGGVLALLLTRITAPTSTWGSAFEATTPRWALVSRMRASATLRSRLPTMARSMRAVEHGIAQSGPPAAEIRGGIGDAALHVLVPGGHFGGAGLLVIRADFAAGEGDEKCGAKRGVAGGLEHLRIPCWWSGCRALDR